MTERILERGKLFGIVTDAWTGEKTRVEFEYEILPHEFKYAKAGEKIFRLIGGVTGFESFIIEPDGSPLPELKETGWCGCAGTPRKYDKLFIPPEEMRKVKLNGPKET